MPLFEQLGEMFNPANAANKHKINIPAGHSATINRYRDCIVVEIEPESTAVRLTCYNTDCIHNVAERCDYLMVPEIEIKGEKAHCKSRKELEEPKNY
jgi:hypothetical protein